MIWWGHFTSSGIYTPPAGCEIHSSNWLPRSRNNLRNHRGSNLQWPFGNDQNNIQEPGNKITNHGVCVTLFSSHGKTFPQKFPHIFNKPHDFNNLNSPNGRRIREVAITSALKKIKTSALKALIIWSEGVRFLRNPPAAPQGLHYIWESLWACRCCLAATQNTCVHTHTHPNLPL